MLQLLNKWWRINDKLPDRIDVIAPISYGDTGSRLTTWSYETISLAKKIATEHREARIVFGSFSKNPTDDEEKRKKEFLAGMKTVYIGKVRSTTDESEAIIKELHPGETVVIIPVTEHAPRYRVVWKYLSRNTKTYFHPTKFIPGDKDNPMIIQRYSFIWLFINIALFPFYKFWPGVSWFAKKNFGQPT